MSAMTHPTADTLRAWRACLGMTQRQLGEALGYGTGADAANAIGQKENGRRPVTRRDLLACRGLHCEAYHMADF